jgi:hypothetical protein
MADKRVSWGSYSATLTIQLTHLIKRKSFLNQLGFDKGSAGVTSI